MSYIGPTCVGKSVRCVSFSLDPAMRSISSANLRDSFSPSDCNSANEALQYILLVCSEKMLKRDADKMQLWQTPTVV